MKMFNLKALHVTAFLVSTFILGIQTTEYKELENLDAFCPNLKDYYKCTGRESTYDDKGCNCDAVCNEYQDCCMNSPDKSTTHSSTRNQTACLPVGVKTIGVYAVTTCSENWVGPSKVRDQCEISKDFHDPLFTAPVTSFTDSVTYRNRYCAECNNADMVNLKTFQINLTCPELSSSSKKDQIYTDLKYDKKLDTWGIDKLNTFGNSTTFHTCDIIFDVPDYFDKNVRLCPPNIISTCPPKYGEEQVRKTCEEYMAVVYDGSQGYKNPHCAICNGRPLNKIRCKLEGGNRQEMISLSLLIDINTSASEQIETNLVPTPECPANHIYDMFYKNCRQLFCTLPDLIIVDGKCVQK